MNVFVLAILIYLIYRFIGGFLIPLFRTTKTMRKQFNNMNKQPDQNDRPTNGQQSTAGEPHNRSHSGMSKVGEYIDFEEVI